LTCFFTAFFTFFLSWLFSLTRSEFSRFAFYFSLLTASSALRALFSAGVKLLASEEGVLGLE
jgi:hypothetical protein